MAQMSYEEFSRMTSKSESTGNQVNSTRNNPHYFFLLDDGNTAIVRFNISDIEDIKVISRHTITLNGKRRSIECIRNFNDPKDVCPLCASGNKPSFRIYLELLSYKIEDGKIIAEPGIWDQPTRFRGMLKSYYMEYGDLRNVLFKVTRHGKKGDTNTSYFITPADPRIYKKENYVADFSAFDNFDINRSLILNKNKEDLQYYVENGTFPEIKENKVSENISHQQPTTSKVSESNPIRTTYNTEETNSNTEETNSNQNNIRPRRYTY